MEAAAAGDGSKNPKHNEKPELPFALGRESDWTTPFLCMKRGPAAFFSEKARHGYGPQILCHGSSIPGVGSSRRPASATHL